jgi:LmbE family N-acetylglucosaminyl deacetylase
MNAYQQLVSQYTRLLQEGKTCPLGNLPPLPRPALAPDAPKVLIFSPHPDDECIIGALALRLMREAKMQVFNVAVTQGSNKERQAGRWQELQNACAFLGFGLLSTGATGLEKINPQTRQKDQAHWNACVKVIAKILGEQRPRVIFIPHDQDWNSTHIGTHLLVKDALTILPESFQTIVVETEYWGQMTSPNLMVELSTDHVADLVAALSCHAGEVKRNAFHLRLPAWMQDNVRRGAELVGGQGCAAPDFIFATLYRVYAWRNRRALELSAAGKLVPCVQNAGEVFGWSC